MDYNTEKEVVDTQEQVVEENNANTQEVVVEENTTNAQNVVVESGNPNKANTLQIVGLILGILAIVICCCLACGGLVLGIAGLVCAILGNKQGVKNGIGTAGFICSIVAIALSVINMIIGALLPLLGMTVPNMQNLLNM